MAERRMFTQKITEADAFTTLPPTTQCLYFHLCMNADDDGFSNKIRQAMFNAHADQNDFEMLIQKRFILPFESGVIVIKHWRMHNLIRSDRYHETDYLEEKATLILKENGVYTNNSDSDNQVTTKRQPSDNQTTTEVRLGKDSIVKDSIEEVKKGNNNIYSRVEIPYKEIIDYLNLVCGTKYKSTTKKTQDFIKARWNEGFRLDDFKQVINNKASEWINDAKWSKFLRPETLFGNKFEGYLNQAKIKPVTRGGIEIDSDFRKQLENNEVVNFNVGG